MGALRSALIALCACCSACAPPDGLPRPSDALRSAQGTAWLVRRVSFADMVFGVAHGYDVDGVDSLEETTGVECVDRAHDYTSASHPSLRGVDTAGADLISTAESLFDLSFAAELDRAVAERRIRWAIRIGSFDADERSLPVDLVAIDASPELALDSGGLPAEGQALRGTIVTSAVLAPEESSAAGLAYAEGLPVDGFVPLLPFADLRLAGMVVDASVAPSGTLFVDLGGSFSVDALMTETMRFVDDPDGDFTLARDLYELVADLAPSPGDPRTCERVSIGLALEAVPLELTLR